MRIALLLAQSSTELSYGLATSRREAEFGDRYPRLDLTNLHVVVALVFLSVGLRLQELTPCRTRSSILARPPSSNLA